MIIGIDGNEANTARRVGIGEFSYQMLSYFAQIADPTIRFDVYLKHSPRNDFPDITKNWHYKVFGPRRAWTQFALPARLFVNMRRPHVFFSPSHYAPRFSPVPTVISLMDLSYIQYPDYFTKKDLYQLTNWTAYSVKNAAMIFTISNASKDDIMKIYRIPEEKIAVLYPGIKPHASLTPHVFPMNELMSKYGITKEFILFVGTLQPRKNITRLIEAFAKIQKKKDHKDLQLVVVGKKGWKFDEILSSPKKYGVEEQVLFLDFVPDDELTLLYQHAQCYVLPSLYEGFGLPVLEAMKNNCPVITSNISSLPEAGGDAALYIDPHNTEDIAEKMEKLLEDKNLRSELIQKGREQVKKFSWEKTAREALNILQEVGGK